jgi:hypothetical protein
MTIEAQNASQDKNLYYRQKGQKDWVNVGGRGERVLFPAGGTFEISVNAQTVLGVIDSFAEGMGGKYNRLLVSPPETVRTDELGVFIKAH